jgi:uncharacterized repeat protein (TIGR01451 family)
VLSLVILASQLNSTAPQKKNASVMKILLPLVLLLCSIFITNVSAQTFTCTGDLLFTRQFLPAPNSVVSNIEFVAGDINIVNNGVITPNIGTNASAWYGGYIWTQNYEETIANGKFVLSRVNASYNKIDFSVDNNSTGDNLPATDWLYNAAGVTRNGIMYLLQGSTYTIHAIDLTTPNPTYVDGFPKTLTGISEAAGNVIWGDIAVDPRTNKVYCWYHPTTASPFVQRGLYEIEDLNTPNPFLTKVGASTNQTMGTLFFNDRAQLFGYGAATVGGGQNLFFAIDKDGGSIAQYGLSDSTVTSSDGSNCPFRITLDRAANPPVLNIPRCGIDTFSYDFSILNFSTGTATNVTFTDTLSNALSYVINTAVLQAQLQAMYGAGVVVSLGSFGAGSLNNVLNITGLDIAVGSYTFKLLVRIDASRLPNSTSFAETAWLKGIPNILGGPNEPSNNPLTFGPKDPTTIAINFNGSNCMPPTANNFENVPIQQGIVANKISGLTAGDPDGFITTYNITQVPPTTEGQLLVGCAPLFTGATCTGGLQAITASVLANYPNGVPLTLTQAQNLRFTPNISFIGNAEILFTVTDNVGLVSNTAKHVVPVAPVAPKCNNLMHANITRTGGISPLMPLSAADVDGSISQFFINSIPTAASGVLSAPCTPLFTGASCSGGLQIITPTVLSNYPAGIPLTAAQASGLQFNPNTTFTGLANFNYSCIDNSGNLSNTANYNIPVIFTLTFDMPPLANNIEAPKLANNLSNTAIPKLTASDIAGTIANYRIKTLPPAATGVLRISCPDVPAGFTCSGGYANMLTNVNLTSAQAANLYFDPTASYIGPAAFTFVAFDATLKESNVATYTIPVGNDKPTALNVNTKVPLNATNLNIPAFGGSDKDGAITNFTITSLPPSSSGYLRMPCGPTPAGGSCSGGFVNLTSAVLSANPGGIPLTPTQAASLQFTGVNGYSGNFTFNYFTADNNTQPSNPASYAIAIRNEPPISYDVNNATLPNTNGPTAINGLNSSDLDGTITSFALFSVPQLSAGVFTTSCDIIFTGASCTGGRQVITPAIIANYPLGLPLTLGQATSLQFDPYATFTGVVSFTYLSGDNSGNLSNLATVNIPISGVGNLPPIANNVTVNGIPANSGSTVIANLSGFDSDGSLSGYFILTLPATTQGTLSTSCFPLLAGGSCIGGRQNLTSAMLNTYSGGIPLTTSQASSLQFDPFDDYAGITTFTYMNADNLGLTSNTAMYTIPALNLQPIAQPIVTNSVLSTAGAASIPNLNSLDYDGTIKSYFIESLPTTVQGVLLVPCTPAIIGATCSGGYQALTAAVLANYPNGHIPLSVAQANGMQFDPASGYIGDVVFNYHGMDNGGNVSNSTTYTIPVNGFNPTGNDVVMATMAHNSPATAVNAINATDLDGSIAYYVLSSVPLPSQGVLSIPCPTTPMGATCSGGFADITQAVLNANGGNVVLTPAQAAGLRFDPTNGFRGNAIFNFAAYDNFNSLSNHATYVIPVDNFVVLNNASVVLQATKNGAQISTTWQAINQQQIQSYLIQHSTDNAVFTTAATLTANASNPDYAFLIANITEAVYYVRIKIISVNGLVSYSNTVKVGGNFSAIVKSVVAPNPSNGVTNLQITLANSQMVNYKVTNSLGQVIFVYNTKLNAGFNSVPLNCLQKVQAGTYFVTFNLGQQTVTHKLQILNK